MKTDKLERPAAPLQVVGGLSVSAAFAGVMDPGKISLHRLAPTGIAPEPETYDCRKRFLFEIHQPGKRH